VRAGLAAGADEYLTKPFSPVRLLSLVETLIPGVTLWARK
jgi:DNA-binding response OmpR family regulator